MMPSKVWLLSLLLLASCQASPRWQDDMQLALSTSRRSGQELVVYFALPGRDASDLMQSRFGEPIVLEALARGSFAAVVVDGVERKRLYQEWIGGGEGMGIAVLDATGYCYAARPGPQDPEQVAAMLHFCKSQRRELARLRAAAQQASATPLDQYALGCLLLDLGCRVHSEPLLLDAAVQGVVDARHRVARLYALDGNVSGARGWLKAVPKTPAAMVTEGYVLFKERRHKEAAEVFAAALATNKLGSDRQFALLYQGKSLHEDKRDEQAIPILEALAAERTGSTFEAGARHTLGHIYKPDDGHTH